MAIRHRTSLEGSEPERRGNHEAVLRPPGEVAGRFPLDRDAVERTALVAERCEFDLTQELGYRYPDFSDGAVPAIKRLAEVCNQAFSHRYSEASNNLLLTARARLDEELALIDEIGLAGFFLLHYEVLELAREVAVEVRGRESPRNSLPPGRGRGSSVGSIVCYLTGLSHVDPVSAGLSLGRFINRELTGVPDIDLDFPRDIREKLIVAVTERYGREHAALVASFSTYRSRGAIRDIGKALGLPHGELERLARVSDGWNAKRVAEELRLVGLRGSRSLAALARLRRADARDRGAAAAHLPAPRRDGDLDPPAGRARARSAGGDGRAAARSVGQGLLRRRGLPEDRPARAGDALGGRGVRGRDRAEAERADRPVADPAGRPRDVRADPGCGHGRRVPDREPRADADDPPHPARDARGHHGAGRLVRPGPIRARPSTRTSSGGSGCGKTRRTSRRPTIRCCRSRCGTRSASSSSRTRCWRWRWRWQGSARGRRKGCGGR